jgi:hypothetical protein
VGNCTRGQQRELDELACAAAIATAAADFREADGTNGE